MIQLLYEYIALKLLFISVLKYNCFIKKYFYSKWALSGGFTSIDNLIKLYSTSRHVFCLTSLCIKMPLKKLFNQLGTESNENWKVQFFSNLFSINYKNVTLHTWKNPYVMKWLFLLSLQLQFKIEIINYFLNYLFIYTLYRLIIWTSSLGLVIKIL